MRLAARVRKTANSLPISRVSSRSRSRCQAVWQSFRVPSGQYGTVLERLPMGAEGRLGSIEGGAIAPRQDAGPVSPRKRPEPFTARLGRVPFLPDAADRLAILQHVVVEKVGVDRRPDVELT